MKARVKLMVETVKDSVAQALYSTLTPDNRNFPRGLKMNMRVEDELLILDLVSWGRVETLISTIDEILDHIQTSLETLEKTV